MAINNVLNVKIVLHYDPESDSTGACVREIFNYVFKI